MWIKRVLGAGIDLTSSRSGGECLVRLAIEAFLKKRAKSKYLIIKLTKKRDQKWDPLWSHVLVPRFGPTFCGDLVKIGREWKRETKSVQSRIRSDVLSVRRQALYALGRGGSILIVCKITLLKHQNDDWSHLSVPLFGPTFFILHFP